MCMVHGFVWNFSSSLYNPPGVFHVSTVAQVQLCAGSCGRETAEKAGNLTFEKGHVTYCFVRIKQE